MKTSTSPLRGFLTAVALTGVFQHSLQASDLKPDRAVTYKKVDGVELKLHVFEPKDLKKGDKRSAAVFFFGGGWNGGTPSQFYAHAAALSDLGMVTFCADYRVKSRNKTTPFECVMDGKSAIRWVREHADELGVDPTRIVSAGGSAGGHIAACTDVIEGNEEKGDNLKVSSRPNATILFNPVLDTTKKGYGSARFTEEKQTALSPCHHVAKGLAPTIVFHGTKDTTVPFENAERYVRLMKEAGNDATLESYPGKGHGFFNSPAFRKKSDGVDYESSLKHSIAFLRELEFLEAEGPKND